MTPFIKKTLHTMALTLILAFNCSGMVTAQESTTVEQAEALKTDMLAFSIGYYDANDNEEALDWRAEYRWQKPLIWKIKPFAGLEGSSEGALYALGGIYVDWEFTPHFYFTPSFGAGLYSDGGGKDLGHTIEFRSQLEFDYEFENRHRISFAASHISNANIENRNPGTEVLSIYYQIPADILFGK